MFALQGIRAPYEAPENQEPTYSQPVAATLRARPFASPALKAVPALEPALRFMPGSVIEVSGPDARREVAELLARYPFCPAAWIEQQLEPFPEEIRRVRLHWDRVLFVDGREDSAWALTSFVNSGVFPFVVYYAPYGEPKALARLRRQAKATEVMVILLRENPFPELPVQAQFCTEGGNFKLVAGARP